MNSTASNAHLNRRVTDYDWTATGQLRAERWPAGRQTTYEYDSADRRIRVRYPVQTGDMVRYEYDATAGNTMDQEEVSRIVHEVTTPGSTYLVWARAITRDPLGRLLGA